MTMQVQSANKAGIKKIAINQGVVVQTDMRGSYTIKYLAKQLSKR